MIRCVRMWTGEDGDSLFEEGWIDLATGTRGDSVGEPVPVPLSTLLRGAMGGFFFGLSSGTLHLAPGLDAVETLVARLRAPRAQ